MAEIWRRVAATSGAKLYAAIVGVFTLSITARYLGPSGRGEVATITTWVGMVATLGALSLGQIAIHRASAARSGDSSWLPEAFRVLGALTVALSVVGTLFALALRSTTSLFGQIELMWLALGLAMLPAVIWEQYGSSLLMAREELRIVNRAQVVARTLSAGLVALLVGYLGFGVPAALFATLVGQTLVSGWILVHLLPVSRPLGVASWGEIGSYLRDGTKLHLNAVGAFLISGMDVLMVSYYRGPHETGLYQLGVQLTTLMLIVPQAASMVVYGKVARLGPDASWPEHRRVLRYTVLLMIAASVAVGTTAPVWLTWIAGAEFMPAVEIFRWQLLGVVGMTFSTLMAAQWIGRGYFWQASLLTVAVGAANFIANMALVPRYGAFGAVWATLGCYLFSILGNGWMVMLCEAKTRKVAS